MSSAAIASRPGALSAPLPAWTVRDLARVMAAEASSRALSAVSSQEMPFSALRTYCAVAARSAFSCMMSLAPMGLSDGRVICLPLDSCSCSVDERPSDACRFAYVVSAIERCVIRNISDPPVLCG